MKKDLLLQIMAGLATVYIGFTLFVLFMLPTQLDNNFIYFQF